MKKYLTISSSLFAILLLSGCFHLSPVIPSNAASLRIGRDVEENRFSFMIDERYLKAVLSEPPSKEHPQLKKPVENLLNKKLKKQDYCINKDGDLSYVITGSQGTVYEEIPINKNDIIAKSGRNRQVIVPFTYFGKCVKSGTDTKGEPSENQFDFESIIKNEVK